MNNDERTQGLNADGFDFSLEMDNKPQSQSQPAVNFYGKKRCMGCMDEYSNEYSICPKCGYSADDELSTALQMRPGTRLGNRYIIGKAIGVGGFSITYIAWDTTLNIKVAIKEYMPSEFSTRSVGQTRLTIYNGDKKTQFDEGKDKFFDEAKRLSKFSDEEGIVRVYDSFEENSTAYIVMEYLEGETLSEYLEKNGKIDSLTAINMITPIMKSLDRVHNAGIIHRDVSPDNIFVTSSGAVKLLDFGASRFATATGSRSLTVLIKKGYSAEEQYRSRGDQGPHTDVYAMGATLYKMITGEAPPDSLERRTRYETKREELLKPIEKLTDNTTKNHRYAIYNALNIQIEDRTSTMQGFLDELQCSAKVKLRNPTIKRIDLYNIPQWIKYVVPSVLSLIIVLSCLLAFGVIGPKAKSNKYVDSDGNVQVPNIMNMTIAEATRVLKDYNLKPLQMNVAISKNIPVDKIMAQSPRPGELIHINDSKNPDEWENVLFIISDGFGRVYIPNVVGLTEEEARTTLEALGFIVEFGEEVTSVQAIGLIAEQSIAEGERYEKGQKITLSISKGLDGIDTSEISIVPNLIGESYSNAVALLAKSGFQVSPAEIYIADKPEGVISQNPSAGTEAHKGEIIELTINVKSATFPNVYGRQEQDARDELLKNGFNKITVEYGTDPKKGCANGAVFDTNQVEGSKVDKGSNIILYIQKSENSDKNNINYNWDTENNISIVSKVTQSNTIAEWSKKQNPISSEPTTPTTTTQKSVKTYTISYNANRGSGAPASQTKTEGETLKLSTIQPTRSGYTFRGWSENGDENSNIYPAGGSYTKDNNVTLYAVWEPTTQTTTTQKSVKTYTISYNAKGGSGAPASQIKTEGVTLTLSSIKPTKSGYTFLGWSTSSAATTATYTAGGSYTKDNNVTLYAVWEPTTQTTTTLSSTTEDGYEIAFRTNEKGVKGMPNKVTISNSFVYYLPEKKPECKNKTFKGWQDVNDVNRKEYYMPGDKYDAKKSTTFVAVFE